jgi:hypothetical protein
MAISAEGTPLGGFRYSISLFDFAIRFRYSISLFAIRYSLFAIRFLPIGTPLVDFCR